MKFCSLVLELHLPQNFCHTHTDTQTYRHTDTQTYRHTDTQTDRQTFSKNSQIVFRTSQNLYIHRKPEIENLQKPSSSTYIEESNKEEDS